jgi:hypothetical protein
MSSWIHVYDESSRKDCLDFLLMSISVSQAQKTLDVHSQEQRRRKIIFIHSSAIS